MYKFVHTFASLRTFVAFYVWIFWMIFPTFSPLGFPTFAPLQIEYLAMLALFYMMIPYLISGFLQRFAGRSLKSVDLRQYFQRLCRNRRKFQISAGCQWIFQFKMSRGWFQNVQKVVSKIEKFAKCGRRKIKLASPNLWVFLSLLRTRLTRRCGVPSAANLSRDENF